MEELKLIGLKEIQKREIVACCSCLLPFGEAESEAKGKRQEMGCSTSSCSVCYLAMYTEDTM